MQASRFSSGPTAVDDLLRRAAESGDEREAARLRHEAVVRSMPLARSVARRYQHRGEASEDLEQVAYLGLVKAVSRYEVGKGATFDAYAVPCIVGEVRRWFRDRGWDVRPPRALQELRSAVLLAVEDLTHELGRAPRRHEVAERLQVSPAQLGQALVAMQAYSAVSLDAPTGEQDGPELYERLAQDDSGVAELLDHHSVEPLLARLPARDRHILSLRFYRDWTQEQIAQDLGVTQMQVSRLLTRVLRQLRMELQDGAGRAAAS